MIVRWPSSSIRFLRVIQYLATAYATRAKNSERSDIWSKCISYHRTAIQYWQSLIISGLTVHIRNTCLVGLESWCCKYPGISISWNFIGCGNHYWFPRCPDEAKYSWSADRGGIICDKRGGARILSVQETLVVIRYFENRFQGNVLPQYQRCRWMEDIHSLNGVHTKTTLTRTINKRNQWACVMFSLKWVHVMTGKSHKRRIQDIRREECGWRVADDNLQSTWAVLKLLDRCAPASGNIR